MTTTPTAPALAALRRRATDRPAEVRAWITAQSLAVQRELGSAVVLWAVDGARGSADDDAAALAALLREADGGGRP